VLFDWNSDKIANHIGIVESAAGGTLTTIEGNWNNAVCRVKRSADILAVFRPCAVGEKSAPKAAVSVQKKVTDSPQSVYKVRPGDTRWTLFDGAHDSKTWQKVAEFNKIDWKNGAHKRIKVGTLLKIPQGVTLKK
jgi:hypothetical protein